MPTSELPEPLRPLETLREARRSSCAGERLEAFRRLGPHLRDALAAEGSATLWAFDIATFPYPTRFAFDGCARSPAPYVMMTNRMHLVRWRAGGRTTTLLVNPTDAERSREAPFFRRLAQRYGERMTRLLTRFYGTVAEHLASCGVRPDEVDLVTFDHLHVQDLRGLLGTRRPEPGRDRPTPALLPRARLLVQRAEWATLDQLHPLQEPWYIADARRDLDDDRVVLLDGDVALGGGVALLATVGHTAGNHTPVVATADGVYAISENGVAADSYSPEASRIPGVRRAARARGHEVVLNSNSRELTLEQYSSMVLERAVVDRCRRAPEFTNHLSSSELTAHPFAPWLAPTFSHGALRIGALEPAAGEAPPRAA